MEIKECASSRFKDDNKEKAKHVDAPCENKRHAGSTSVLALNLDIEGEDCSGLTFLTLNLFSGRVWPNHLLSLPQNGHILNSLFGETSSELSGETV